MPTLTLVYKICSDLSDGSFIAGDFFGAAKCHQLTFVLINPGIWSVVVGTTFRAGQWFLLAGRVLEAGAVVFFALHAWKRIVSREGA